VKFGNLAQAEIDAVNITDYRRQTITLTNGKHAIIHSAFAAGDAMGGVFTIYVYSADFSTRTTVGSYSNEIVDYAPKLYEYDGKCYFCHSFYDTGLSYIQVQYFNIDTLAVTSVDSQWNVIAQRPYDMFVDDDAIWLVCYHTSDTYWYLTKRLFSTGVWSSVALTDTGSENIIPGIDKCTLLRPAVSPIYPYLRYYNGGSGNGTYLRVYNFLTGIVSDEYLISATNYCAHADARKGWVMFDADNQIIFLGCTAASTFSLRKWYYDFPTLARTTMELSNGFVSVPTICGDMDLSLSVDADNDLVWIFRKAGYLHLKLFNVEDLSRGGGLFVLDTNDIIHYLVFDGNIGTNMTNLDIDLQFTTFSGQTIMLFDDFVTLQELNTRLVSYFIVSEVIFSGANGVKTLIGKDLMQDQMNAIYKSYDLTNQAVMLERIFSNLNGVWIDKSSDLNEIFAFESLTNITTTLKQWIDHLEALYGVPQVFTQYGLFYFNSGTDYTNSYEVKTTRLREIISESYKNSEIGFIRAIGRGCQFEKRINDAPRTIVRRYQMIYTAADLEDIVDSLVNLNTLKSATFQTDIPLVVGEYFEYTSPLTNVFAAATNMYVSSRGFDGIYYTITAVNLFIPESRQELDQQLNLVDDHEDRVATLETTAPTKATRYPTWTQFHPSGGVIGFDGIVLIATMGITNTHKIGSMPIRAGADLDWTVNRTLNIAFTWDGNEASARNLYLQIAYYKPSESFNSSIFSGNSSFPAGNYRIYRIATLTITANTFESTDLLSLLIWRKDSAGNVNGGNGVYILGAWIT